jgi:hypothetical protein
MTGGHVDCPYILYGRENRHGVQFPHESGNMTAQDRGLTGDQISALEMLADYPNGCTESEMTAKGFTIGLLRRIDPLRTGDGNASDRELGGRTLGVVRVAITEWADNDRRMAL